MHVDDWLDKYFTLGKYGLILGVFLFFISFFTNPVPDPSFPWATLPSSLRLPFSQPRIEHWPVTYTVAIWLWVFFFPVLFFLGYRQFGRDKDDGKKVWLIALPVLAMIGWTTYCRFFWPKLQPPTWNAPAYTFICWLYCSTYDVLWSDAAFVISGFGVISTLLAWKQYQAAPRLLTIFGMLSLPLGLPALVAAQPIRGMTNGKVADNESSQHQ